MVFLQASPLWELVWIPSRGLSLGYVGSGIGTAENNSSILCKAESSNNLVSPAQSPNNMNSQKSDSLSGLKIIKPEVNCDRRNSPKVVILESPERMVSLPITSVLPELESRSDRDEKLDGKMTGAIVDHRSDRYNIDEKKVGSDTPNNIEEFESRSHVKGAVVADMDKVSVSGEHSNSPAADFVVNCQEGSPPKVAEETRHDSDHNESLAGKNHQKPLMPTSSSAERGCVGLDTDGGEEKNIKECNNFSGFDLCSRRCLCIVSSSMEKEIEITSAVRSLSQIALENETSRVNHINNQQVVGSCSAENLSNKNQHKGKEKIKYDNEECDSLSNERKDSNERVESCNSQSKISKGKRALDYDLNTFLGPKKIKVDNSGGSCSRTLVKRESSFLNWMSNITSSKLIPLELCQNSPESIIENFVSLHMTDKKAVGSERLPLGFTNVFQSLHSSSGKNKLSDHNIEKEINDQKVSNKSSSSLGQKSDEREANGDYTLMEGHQVSNKSTSSLGQKSNERKELDSSKDLSDDDRLHLLCNEENDLSKVAEPNRGVYQVKEHPLQTSSNMQTQMKGTCDREISPTKMVHPNSTTKNSILYSKDFKHRMLGSVQNSTPSAALNSSKNFVENMWISRFLCNDSSLVVRPISCRFGIELENDTRPNKNSDASSRSQDNQVNHDSEKAGNHFLSHLVYENNATSKELHQETTSPVLSNLWRTSFFIKRLDALKHIVPVNASDELPPYAPTTLTSSGKNDPNFQGSSGSDGIDKQLIIDNDIPRSKGLHQLINFSYGRITTSVHKESEIINSPRGQYGMHHNYNAHRICSVNETTAPVTRHLNASEGDIEKSVVSKKQFTLSLRENDAKDNHLKPLCYSATHEASNEQTGTFEAIRRLRLSRTDVIRLLKSPKAQITLKGFFLRLRLGKCEGLGGTGYHVARINGAGCEKSISVNIGCLAYIVDCRFVSNCDYLEDELKAWWFAMLKSGEIPSKEELNRKINERVKFGF